MKYETATKHLNKGCSCVITTVPLLTSKPISPMSSSLNVCTTILDSPTEPCEDSALIRNLYLTPGCNPVFFEAEK